MRAMDRINKILEHRIYIEESERIRLAETGRIFCGHDIRHSLDVARIAYILNLREQLGVSRDEIYAMAILHDLGRGAEYAGKEPHHTAGSRLAREILTDCGFTVEETEKICEAIALHKTKTEENDKNPMIGLLFRADKLSRECFSCRAYDACYWPEEQKNHGITV